tara:strand:- start:1495 stop:3108 length:1614 start_codon:yes stop_codon:yes gene_type:complete
MTAPLKEEIDQSLRQLFHGMDIPWMLEQWASKTPDKVCLYFCPFEGAVKAYTYSDLLESARSLASGLYDQGVRPGNFVILHMDNSSEFIISWYACAVLGAVAVSTNTRSVGRDLSYFAEVTEAVYVLTQPMYARMIRQACPELAIALTDNNSGEEAANHLAIQDEVGGLAFSSLFSSSLYGRRNAPVPEDNLSVQFTSGTTSRPKAVLWTHANGLWAGRITAQHLKLRADDVTLIYMPLFHTNAQAYSMLATHWSGGTIVVQPKFSASRFWQACLEFQVTWASMIPFSVKALMDRPVPKHHMRFWGLGAHVPELGSHFGVDTLGWWGMTETLTQGTIVDFAHLGPMGTIGRVAPEYEIQIRDDEGKPLSSSGKGQLYIRGVRGVSLFKEYYRNSEANDAVFDGNGWFDTGDVVNVDEAGWLFFSDRSKDMLKVGAENVAASEVESVVGLSGLVAECAVVGQKHYMLDEVPVVFVIPSTSAREMTSAEIEASIIELCAENLPDFKVVRSVHIVDELPRSTLEKVAKNILRNRLPEITS